MGSRKGGETKEGKKQVDEGGVQEELKICSLTLNLPTLLEAEYGHLIGDTIQRPPSCMTDLSALPLASRVTLDHLFTSSKTVSSSTK